MYVLYVYICLTYIYVLGNIYIYMYWGVHVTCYNVQWTLHQSRCDISCGQLAVMALCVLASKLNESPKYRFLMIYI